MIEVPSRVWIRKSRRMRRLFHAMKEVATYIATRRACTKRLAQ